MTATSDQSVSDAVTAGAHATEIARSGASNLRGAAGGGADPARVSAVVGAALEGIRAAIRDHEVTYEEFDAFKQWLIAVSDTGEWPLFLDVYLEFEVEKVAAATQQGSIGTILGPFWLDGQAQLDSPATLPMRDDEPGTPMILAGQVTATDGTPLAGREGRHLAHRLRRLVLRLRREAAGREPARRRALRRPGPLRDPHPQAGAVHDPPRRAHRADDPGRRLEPVAPRPHPPARHRARAPHPDQPALLHR